ncbi:MAG: glycosyltransferase family 29 protein [Desulfarculales bacterium]|jgi:tetratricopeptide (TPR) repeat protein|nr:glycosyltransferase family 29 protein [Desulfarculales bacterium]
MIKTLKRILFFPKTLIRMRDQIHESAICQKEILRILDEIKNKEYYGSLAKIEEITRTTRHLLLLKEINPDLVSVLKKELAFSKNVIESLRYGPYRKFGDNRLLSELFIQVMLDTIQSSSHYPCDSAKNIFCELLRIFPENFQIFVRYIDFLYYGAQPNLEEMFALCTEFEQHPYAENISYRATWQTYINALLILGRREKAAEVLHRYIKLFGTDTLELFFAVAHLARESGYSTLLISKAADIWEHIIRNRDDKILENMLKGKTVAVVGNGPQELSLGKGKEIDGHDIVIRFNRGKITDYPDDYGKKITVWVRTAYLNSDFLPPWADIIITHPLDLYKVYSGELVEVLHDLIFSSNIQLFSPPPDLIMDIRRKMRHPMPSVGTVLLTWLKTIKSDFMATDTYGFSYKNDDVPYVDNYCQIGDGVSNFNYVHDFQKEKIFLRKIMRFNGNAAEQR